MKRLYITLLIAIILVNFHSCNVVKNKTSNSSRGIIENSRIDIYSLSITKNELDKIGNVKIDTLDIYLIYILPDIKIWYDTNAERTDQICAYNNYSGKFRNAIGINDSISELAKIGKFYFQEDEEIYQLSSIKGISFNVPEQDLDLQKDKHTIDYICIYR